MCLCKQIVSAVRGKKGCTQSKQRQNNHSSRTYARLVSAEVPGCLETSLRDWASIWSNDRFTEGRSGRERWEVRALEALRRAERSEAMAAMSSSRDLIWRKECQVCVRRAKG